MTSIVFEEWAAGGAIMTVRGGDVACALARTEFFVDGVLERGSCFGPKRSACCQLATNARSANCEGLLRPGWQGHASECDLIGLVELRGGAEDTAERVDEVPL